MRILQLFFLLGPCYGWSQADSIVEYSRLEKMIMEPGSFVNINSHTIGGAGNLAIGILTATDLKDGKKQRSVCFNGANSLSNTFFSYNSTQVDIQELIPFINALITMKEAIDSRNSSGQQTYQYTSSNLTVLSLENRIGNPAKWDIAIYKRYKNLNVMVPGSCFFLKGRDIGELTGVLSRYKDSLRGNFYD